MSVVLSDTTNVLVNSALEYLRTNAPDTLVHVDMVALETGLQSALFAVLPADVGLTTYKPDYESILLHLTQALQTDTAWKDVIVAGTGATLLRNIASGLSALHVALIRATQENFGHLAQGDNAVLASTRFLGVNPRRRVPAQVGVRVTADDYSGAFEVPRLSAWDVAGVNYFNRERVVFGEIALTQTIALFEGTVFDAQFEASGAPFERITIGSNNGRISAADVYVRVNGVEWTSVQAMWNTERNARVFRERTDGANVTIQFGDGVYGARLPAGATVDVQWVETEGVNSANVPLGTAVAGPFVNANVGLTGVTTTAPFGADLAVPISVYRVMAPHLRTADKTAINRINFRALAVDYPGIADAIFRGQAELNPNLRSWMNIYSITLLPRTGVPFTQDERDAFIAWLQPRVIDNLEFIWSDPYPIIVDLSATVYVNRDASLSVVKPALETSLRKSLEPRLGSLGYSYYSTDIGTLLEGVNSTDPLLDRLVEYADNVQLTYAAEAPAFVGAEQYPTAGLVRGNLIMPNTQYYAVLRNVDIAVDYTTRDYTGRRDT